jgi:hypothetical protein
LPDDLKVRISRLRHAGVSFSDIRRVTGVQANSIKAWAKKLPRHPRGGLRGGLEHGQAGRPRAQRPDG